MSFCKSFSFVSTKSFDSKSAVLPFIQKKKKNRYLPRMKSLGKFARLSSDRQDLSRCHVLLEAENDEREKVKKG